ncbi:hypothetical protein K456DRAFT_891101 [Colletotrichum gloeosporioides 23]|nr:hypothetical protein K456DRAFT_891101 [Colletotrichum gloeosporioides 23]
MGGLSHTTSGQEPRALSPPNPFSVWREVDVPLPSAMESNVTAWAAEVTHAALAPERGFLEGVTREIGKDRLRHLWRPSQPYIGIARTFFKATRTPTSLPASSSLTVLTTPHEEYASSPVLVLSLAEPGKIHLGDGLMHGARDTLEARFFLLLHSLPTHGGRGKRWPSQGLIFPFLDAEVYFAFPLDFSLAAAGRRDVLGVLDSRTMVRVIPRSLVWHDGREGLKMIERPGSPFNYDPGLVFGLLGHFSPTFEVFFPTWFLSEGDSPHASREVA